MPTKKPSILTSFLCTVETEKRIPDLIDQVAARAWTLDGVKITGLGVVCTKVSAEPFERQRAAQRFGQQLTRRMLARDGSNVQDAIGELLEDVLMRHGGITAPGIRPNCFSNDDGDTWLDCPADAEFVDGLKDGEIFELQASVRAWPVKYRVVRDPESDDVDVIPVDGDCRPPPARSWTAAELALQGLVDHYTRLVNSGDAGNWDPEEGAVVLAARAALAIAPAAKPTSATDGGLHRMLDRLTD